MRIVCIVTIFRGELHASGRHIGAEQIGLPGYYGVAVLPTQLIDRDLADVAPWSHVIGIDFQLQGHHSPHLSYMTLISPATGWLKQFAQRHKSRGFLLTLYCAVRRGPAGIGDCFKVNQAITNHDEKNLTRDVSMLSVDGINLKKGGKQILSDVSFEVDDGEIFGILGANGAGKSSLAFALMGSPGYQPDRGSISFDGVDITHMPMDERARLGITLAWQEPARFEGITVPDFVLLGSSVKGNAEPDAGDRDSGAPDSPDTDPADRCLELLRLTPSEYNHRLVDKTLSGGERKKVELASVLAMRPKLAILDEPDSGIDMISQEAVISMIYEIRDYGGSVILITHEEEVVKVADRAALMCSGLAFKTGGTQEIVDYYRGRCAPCTSKSFPSPEDTIGPQATSPESEPSSQQAASPEGSQ